MKVTPKLLASYRNAPRNIRRFLEGKSVVQTGSIQGLEQTTRNVMQITRYLNKKTQENENS